MSMYVGIDIGGTDIKYGLIDDKGHVHAADKIPTPKTKKELLKSLKMICHLYEEAEGVGISAPGMIRHDGLMLTAGALFDCYGMNMIEEIQRFYTGVVAVENDVNCAALAELWTGNGRKHEHFLVVTVGTGIGGAIVINRELYRGSRFMAGEFGFMKMNPLIRDDTNHTMLSRNGSVYGGLIWMYEEKTGQSVDGITLFQKAEAGDTIAEEIIDRFYTNLSTAVFNLIVALDPEVVLIGGAISMREGFIDTINNKIASIKAEYSEHLDVPIAHAYACTHLNDAGMIGAVAHLLKNEKKL